MTNEEAINELKERYLGISAYANKELCQNANKALDIAISALEKQIRKKPNLWNGEITTCPNCLRAIRQTEPLDVHCIYCGQFIDWSDEE